jgi:CysZ protein
MKFIQDFLKAIGTCFKSIDTIFQKGLWPYLLYPLLFWIVVLVASFWVFADIANSISEYLNTYFNFKNIPDSGSWLSVFKPFLTTYFSFILAIVLKLIFWYVISTFSKYLILIFLSPLFALLSESTEEKLYGNKYPFSFSQLLKDIMRGVGISLRNMFFEYSIMFICFILTIVFPPLAIITTPFLFLVSWYFIGFTLLDYNFERHKMNIKESTQFIRKNIGIACGLGVTYFGFMLLPFYIGVMLAPVITVVAGTILFLEIKHQDKAVII